MPTDEEWKQLEGTVDSQYGYPDPEWDDTGWNRFDVGERLKSENGWYNYGNGSDWYGFAGLPGGLKSTMFEALAIGAYFWSSSEDGWTTWIALGRVLPYHNDQVYRSPYDQLYGFSVRCVRD